MAQEKKAQRPVKTTEEREIAKNLFAVAPGVWRLKDIFVNVYFVQDGDGMAWALIDAGLKTSYSKIKEAAELLFDKNNRPACIIMTHGHFDHVGSLRKLADEWNVPIYAHHLELPYLTGASSYPPPDPAVGGGIMPFLSLLFPRSPIDVEDRLNDLPEDESVPYLPEWKWIHTPGHAPGHISIFRESDKVLIAGDAVVTTRQESARAIMTQKKVFSGPPKYFTADWGKAATSVRSLVALQPKVIATGHGQSYYGTEAKKELNKLSKNFWKLGMPESGRYVSEPALANETGIIYIPPSKTNYTLLAAVGLTTLMAVGLYLYRKKKSESPL